MFSRFRKGATNLLISGNWLSSIRAMSTTSSRVAVAQLRATSDKLENLQNVAKCAGWAQRDGACMLFLPECFGFIGETAKETLEVAEKPLEEELISNPLEVTKYLQETVSMAQNGQEHTSTSTTPRLTGFGKLSLLDGIQTIARQSNLWISGGGMHVAGGPPSPLQSTNARVYNTHVIVDNQGKLQCFYRKIHLFDVSIPGKVNLHESRSTAPGDTLVVCDSPVGKLGITVCYDLRFPEVYIELVNRGAQILLVPSAFTVPTGQAHWHTLLRARAIENQCFVIAAAQYGRHNTKRDSYGHSVVIDPWGVVLNDAGGTDGLGTQISEERLLTPSIIVQDLDLSYLDATRQRMPVQDHRKAATYD